MSKSAIEKKIIELEKNFTVPGTVISRCLKRDSSVIEWSVGLGPMAMPKVFGYGSTIQKALKNAEEKLCAK